MKYLIKDVSERKTTGGYKWVYANKLGGGLNTETI